MDLVTIAQFPTTVEATLAKNLLADEGIEATLADENTGDLFHLTADFGEVKLLVPLEHVEKATKLLQEAHQHGDEEPESAED